MALRMGALYDALLSGNVPEEKARQAAEELAGFDRDMANLRSELTPLKWMVGTNIVLTCAVLGRLLFIK